MTVKLLTEYHLEFLSLTGDCTGSYEATLVEIPHCWKSHVPAHSLLLFYADTAKIRIRQDGSPGWLMSLLNAYVTPKTLLRPGGIVFARRTSLKLFLWVCQWGLSVTTIFYLTVHLGTHYKPSQSLILWYSLHCLADMVGACFQEKLQAS